MGRWRHGVLADRTGDGALDRVPNAIARRCYQMRTVLGLSQQELANLAHVSQGAVSRMESGECAATPLRTVLAVFLALVVELQPRADLCGPELAQVLDIVARGFPFLVENREFTVFADPKLETLLRIYNLFSERERDLFLAVVRPVGELVAARSGEGQFRPGG